MTGTTNEPVPVGAMARVTEDHQGIDRFFHKGDLFIVGEYVSAEQNTSEEAPGAYYMGSDSLGYFNIEIDAEYVELAMTKEQVEARRAPNKEELAEAIRTAVLGAVGENFYIHGSQGGEDGFMGFDGSTNDGVEFGFTLEITDIGQAEW